MGGDFTNSTNPNKTTSILTIDATHSVSFLWVYLFFTYLFVFATFYFTFLNYRDYVRIRREFLLRKAKTLSARTLLVTGIPPHLRSDQKLAEYFEKLGIGVVESVHTIRHVGRLLEFIKERTQYLRQLETVYAKYLGNPSHVPHYDPDEFLSEDGPSRLAIGRDRPTVQESIFCGPQFDAIDLYTKKFDQVDELVEKARKVGKFAPTSVGFVTFEETISAYVASQVLIDSTPFRLRAQLAPEPRDVLWENIAMHGRERLIRKVLVMFILLFLVFSWSIPCNYLSALTSTKSLKAYFPWLLKLAEKNKILNQIVAGFIPTLGVVIFFSVLPLIFNSKYSCGKFKFVCIKGKFAIGLSVIEGFTTRSESEESCFAKQFFFLFFNVLLFITVASTLFKSQKDIFEDPTKIANIFASKLPEVAPFYINYTVLQGIMLCPIQLLQIGPILVQKFYCFFLCKTPRDFAEVYAPRMYNFGWGYPVPVFMFVVVLVYSTISPLILVFGVIYFAMCYLVCKYQLLYVYFHSYEVAGRMWPMVFSRIIIGLIIFELTSAGLFTLNKSFTMAILCVPLLFLTVIYKIVMDKAYQQSTQFLPLQLLSEKFGPMTTAAPILNGGSSSHSSYKSYYQYSQHMIEEEEENNRDKINRIRKRRTVLDEDDYVAEPRKTTDFREPPMTLLTGILNTGMKQYGHPALLGVLPQPWLPMKVDTVVNNSRGIVDDEESAIVIDHKKPMENQPLLPSSSSNDEEGGLTDEEEEEDNANAYFHHPERRLSRTSKEIDEEEHYMSEEEELMNEDDDASSVSSPSSIPDDNIDFDLVYALHTFVATVEGQASVVKGDALNLLEDTNIYWWLVEVLTTSEVGYIPAENIETPYERLARLNKHRNEEITSPVHYDLSPLSELHPLANNTRRVTIADECDVFHFEVESEGEDDDEDENNGMEIYTKEEDQVESEEETRQSMLIENTEHPQNMYQDNTNINKDAQTSIENSNLEQTNQEKLEMEALQDATLQEIRVFAGNINQGPTFHTFSITHQTSADELVRLAVSQFGLQEEHDHSATIEYYVAVQGYDGDEYILSTQDKPLSIFKTLTNSFTTPMPSVSHVRRISQQSMNSTSTKRRRSSSFSNCEQTNHEEDIVVRFYLHQRIKRAHENLVYIKVSLYPETYKQKKPHQMDRMDKVIAVKQESVIWQLIELALEKFHVPESKDKYKLSVNNHQGKEIELDSNEIMFNVLESLSSNMVTSELLFILRKSTKQRKYRFIQQEARRPSILDILMDSSPKNDKARSSERSINTQQKMVHSSSSLFHFNRRSSAPESDSSFMEPVPMARSNSNTMSPVTEKRKESLKQQFKRLVGWGSSNVTTAATTAAAAAAPAKEQSLSVVISDVSTNPDKSRQGSQDINNTSQIEVVSQSPLSMKSNELPEAPSIQESVVSLASASTHEIKQDSEIDTQEEQHKEGAEEENKGEEEENKEEEEEKPSDIQKQYTMWINNQPNETEATHNNSSSLVSSISTSKISLASEVSSTQQMIATTSSITTVSSSIHSNNIKETTTTVTAPVNHGQQEDLDDLYLLVAHGVDFLKTRENTKWEEEGGYEFHPWNRPQSSFAVRPKDKTVKTHQSSKSLDQKPLSPPLTPNPQLYQQTDEQQKELAMSMAKRILSGKTDEIPTNNNSTIPNTTAEASVSTNTTTSISPNTDNPTPTNNNNNQTKPESLDDESVKQDIGIPKAPPVKFAITGNVPCINSLPTANTKKEVVANIKFRLIDMFHKK
ncbi:hypothetical protein G6F22_003893 [Rhizopus arrhizus]|nr:hypothetical protein G6F22_003893 [Rhizopus arrhizus]